MAGKKTRGRKTTARKTGKAKATKKPRAAARTADTESRKIDLLRGWSPSRYSTR